MDRSANSAPHLDEEVLDAKPLRSLAPMFPGSLGINMYNQSAVPPLICVTPAGQRPTGVNTGGDVPYIPFTQEPAGKLGANGYSDASGSSDARVKVAAPVPINATPISSFKTQPLAMVPLDEDDELTPSNLTSSLGRKIKRPSHLSGFVVSDSAADGTNGPKVKQPKVSRKAAAGNEITLPSNSDDPRETVEAVLMTFDALRRRHLQLDEIDDTNRRADLKAGAIMISNNLRANMGKRIGAIPGLEIGDNFYFRMELCIIGLHYPSMGGIDYMTVKYDNESDPVAISIVSAGGYENDEDDPDVLVYSGSGGSSRNEEKQDQKLERGNLALERSLYRKNEIRVVRGYKDPHCLTGKIYIYDGLYKILESWKEKTKSGINAFKYKLVREPEQPGGAAIWKMAQKWIEDPSSRGTVILPDLSSATEHLPVCLVNEVDNEKGPNHFTYVTQVKYLKSPGTMKQLNGCRCLSVCLPGDGSCLCAQHNGGDLPYGSSGLLVSRRPVIYECGNSCQCSFNCRNRVTQKGVKLHFEVFKTANRGWGLRSWDAIRAGMFICEYTGEVIDEVKVNLDDEEDDYVFQARCPGEKTLKWNYGPELLGEQSSYVTADSFQHFPIKISAKKMGNVSRFMNHSCSPNVFWQPVVHDHGDEGHPHIMFFALKHIPAMTELTYDYGIAGGAESSNGASRAKTCLCGSRNCRGYFG